MNPLLDQLITNLALMEKILAANTIKYGRQDLMQEIRNTEKLIQQTKEQNAN